MCCGRCNVGLSRTVLGVCHFGLKVNTHYHTVSSAAHQHVSLPMMQLNKHVCATMHSTLCTLQERLNSNYAELSGAFKTSLEGLARTVQDLHSIIK